MDAMERCSCTRPLSHASRQSALRRNGLRLSLDSKLPIHRELGITGDAALHALGSWNLGADRLVHVAPNKADDEATR